jgi:hypothetical protein
MFVNNTSPKSEKGATSKLGVNRKALPRNQIGIKDPTQYFQVAERFILRINKVPQHQVDWESSGLFPVILNICTELSVSRPRYFVSRKIFSVQAYAKHC